MTTTDGIPIVNVVPVVRTCASCGRTCCLLTDDPNRDPAEWFCVICWMGGHLLTHRSWRFAR